MEAEKRLIFADAAAEAVCYNCMDKHDCADRCSDYMEVFNTPTVDAVEVVHGEWVVEDYDSGDPGYYSAFIEVHCSKCGYELGAESGQYEWSYGDPFPLNYCPNCGARMDGDSE